MGKLTAKQVIAYSKADQKNIQMVKVYTFAAANKARLNAEQPSRSIYRGRCRWRGVQ
jgi:hypothetical protein